MAYVGYPAGSSQAPQSGLPGGALVPISEVLPGGNQADPRFFEELLNKLKGVGKGTAEVASNVMAAPLTGQVARYAPGIAMGLGSFGEGQLGAGVGQITGGVIAGKMSKGAAERAATALAARGLPGPAKLAAPLVGLAAGTAGALGGGMIGRAAEGVVQNIGQTGSNLISALTGQRKEEGKSGIIGGGPGLSNLTGEQKQIAELLRLAGVNIPVEQATALMPIANQMKDADMQRQMQLNQQLGQLTGALNRQQYAFQLAGGAQAQAGENLRTMITSNPYASSTFRS
jgi:hypothetical protein